MIWARTYALCPLENIVEGIDLPWLCACAAERKSAVPIFRRMLASHERSLVAARGHCEPAGQLASREMEIVRIKGALQRAEELNDDSGRRYRTGFLKSDNCRL